MKMPTRVNAIFDRTLSVLAVSACVLLFFAMFSVTGDVVTRYFLGRSLMLWVIELAEYILLYVTLLAAAWLLRREGHVKMEMVINQLRPRTQALVNTITSILGTVVCLALTWYGIQTTRLNFVMGYWRDTTLDPPLFIFHGIVTLGCFLLFIQFARRAHGYMRSWRASSNKEQDFQEQAIS